MIYYQNSKPVLLPLLLYIHFVILLIINILQSAIFKLSGGHTKKHRVYYIIQFCNCFLEFKKVISCVLVVIKQYCYKFVIIFKYYYIFVTILFTILSIVKLKKNV